MDGFKQAVFESVDRYNVGRDVAKLIYDFMGNYVNYESLSGKSALIFACQCRHKTRRNIINLLLDAGASLSEPTNGMHGKPPLLYAVEWKEEALVRLFIDRGANINSQDSKGMTALMRAAQFNDANMVSLLLAKGGNHLIENENGETAADLAKQEGSWNALQHLDMTQIPAEKLDIASNSPVKKGWGTQEGDSD